MFVCRDIIPAARGGREPQLVVLPRRARTAAPPVGGRIPRVSPHSQATISRKGKHNQWLIKFLQHRSVSTTGIVTSNEVVSVFYNTLRGEHKQRKEL